MKRYCKICDSEFEKKGNFAYCEMCRKQWKKPRDVYYHMKMSKTKEYKDKNIRRTIQWQKDNPEQFREIQCQYYNNLKIDTLTFYSPSDSPSCCHCGETNINVLALDHVENNGSKDTRKGNVLYKHALSIKDKTLYQTLCYNCNWKKYLDQLKSKHIDSRTNINGRRFTRNLRHKCISHYSNDTCTCRRCGNNDIEVLCLDHIDDNGGEHRKELFGKNKAAGSKMYKWAIKNNYPAIFQILCLNCNIEKQRVR